MYLAPALRRGALRWKAILKSLSQLCMTFPGKHFPRNFIGAAGRPGPVPPKNGGYPEPALSLVEGSLVRRSGGIGDRGRSHCHL